ncbi:MAG: glycine cleavage system protein H [Phototrophicales bacterium]|nr:MAG: glycine cleavage system protein H [Phototrophicales bacterium]
MAGWNFPEDLKYAKTDEWFRVEGDIVTIGISDYAQDQLSDVVFVELPEVGRQLDAGEAFGVVESVKSTSDLYTAVAGEVVEVNSALEDKPELVNESPYGEGWFIKIKASDLSALESLMDSTAYAEYCNGRE